MKVHPVVSFVSVAALACVPTTPTALTPDGAHVHVSSPSAVDGCEYLGDFVGGMGTVRPYGTGYWEPNQVRNLVAQSGGTDVVFDERTRGHVVGRGYRCP
jgi:hypothetical protein